MFGKFTKLFDVRKQNKQRLFIVLVFFLGSFFLARLYSLFVGGAVFIEGYHIHHFYFGTVALVFGGILGITNNGQTKLKIASALIGVGMGLFADEIGLLLNCTTDNKFCTYAFPDSSDFILIITIIIIFFMTIVGEEQSLSRDITDSPERDGRPKAED